MKKKVIKAHEKKSHGTKKMYKVADSLIECLYINYAELSNTGDAF